jgi:uncharacterized hydrophobic protein (TIGR00341 family)
MSGKILEISCKSGHLETLVSLAEQSSARILSTYEPKTDVELASIRLFVEIEAVQTTLDKIQSFLPDSAEPIILLCPVDAQIGEHDDLVRGDAEYFLATREELFANISDGSKFDRNFMLLALLSTIVAAIGIAENNMAVVIGAMVIAPLLGPNLGLALGSVLGDKELIKTALITNGLGLLITITTSFLIALVWSPNLNSVELLSRTQVQYSSVILALASGVAAVVSLTSRLPNTLVGVMVAVALVPPATVFGMMLGIQNWPLANSAGLLLIINIAAVNFSAQLVFIVRGIRPRTWLAKRAAKQSLSINILVWSVLLLVLVVVIAFQ